MNVRWTAGVVGGAGVILALGLMGCDRMVATGSSTETSDYQGQLRAEATARSKDPAWLPSHTETAVLRVGGDKGRGLLHNFCVNQDGNLLVCWGGKYPGGKNVAAASETTGVKVLSPGGNLLTTWPLDFKPQAICMHPSGTVVVGGEGRLAKLDVHGKTLASAISPALGSPAMSEGEVAAMLKEMNRPASELGNYKTALQRRRNDITGLAVSGQDVFVACAAPKGFAYAVYRVDQELKNPKLVIEKLSGCCGQMDITARDGKLWVAHNGRHLVERYDRDGKKLASFGRTDRRAADGFGGCCEPKNLRLAANGDVFAAESGPPVAIKRFTPEGKFLGVIAVPVFNSGCVRVTVDISPDGKRFYLLDTDADAIHVFAAKP